jgi:8-oxo-dGTP pyrophosphatase MutT (NUDIX family)
LSDKSYQRSLPKKRMSAGVLFFDESGRLLIVEPAYKPDWEIPGGVVELNESPREACIREVKEELGLERPLSSLLCVDYLSESEQKTEAVVFIFRGGVLTRADIRAIRLPAGELRSFAFVEPEVAYSRFNQRLAQRVRLSLEALANNQTLYLEDQRIVTRAVE